MIKAGIVILAMISVACAIPAALVTSNTYGGAGQQQQQQGMTQMQGRLIKPMNTFPGTYSSSSSGSSTGFNSYAGQTGLLGVGPVQYQPRMHHIQGPPMMPYMF